jgi:hypothetical protein
MFVHHPKVAPGQFGVLTDGAALGFADSLLLNKALIRTIANMLKNIHRERTIWSSDRERFGSWILNPGTS